MSSYKTLSKSSSALLKEKASKFYAYAYPIENKEDVKVILENLKAEHPKAGHICTALRIGIGDEEYTLTNDDGEPGNSAGPPILSAIKAADITNSFVAVVRYFGGTKLGVGGLIRAYREAAQLAIEENKIKVMELSSSFTFFADYQTLGTVLSIADRNQLELQQEHQKSGVLIKIVCKKKDIESTKGLFDSLNLSIN